MLFLCSICCAIDIRSRERYSIDVIASLLRRCMWRANAWNSNNDSNTTIHTNSRCSGDGFAVDALPDCVGHFRFDQLRRLRYMGKFTGWRNLVTWFWNYNFWLFIVEHWSSRPMFAMVAMGPTEFTSSHPRAVDLPNRLLACHRLRHRCTNDCQPRWNGLRLSDDPVEHPRLRGVRCMEE